MESVDENRVEVEENPTEVRAEDLQPGWPNAPTASKLQNDVRDAEPTFNEHVSDVKHWLSLRDGNLKVKVPKGRSVVQPRLIRKQNEWRYASLTEALLASEDMYDVLPATHADVTAARDNAVILNKQFRVDIDRVEFIDSYVRTAVDEGSVIVRTGWEFEEEIIEVEEEVTQIVLPPQVQLQLQQAAQAVRMGQIPPEQFAQMQAQAQQMAQEIPTGETRIVEKTVTLYNRPTLEVCEYDKVLLDPTCNGDLDAAGFIAYQFETSKAELNEDPKYSNVDSIAYDSETAIGQERSEEVAFNYDDDIRRKITAIEYWGDWDIHNDGTLVPIVATYVGPVMIRLEENPFPDRKPPFVKVVYLPKRRDVYGGEPDAVLIEDHQDIIGAITRGMIDLMGKSANAQQGISADALDPAQKIRFEQGKDYLFNPDVDPSKAFFMATYPEIPRSALEMIQFHEQGAEALTSIRAFSAGQGGNALGSTAAAVKSASDATNKREMAILRRLSTGIVDIGYKITAMNAVNLEDEEIIMITDEEEVRISREALAGKFDLRLSVSTPEVDQEQAQDLGFMLQTIGPNMDPSLQQIILGEIARLKKMPQLAKTIEEYQPKPDPMAEEIKKLQKDLLEAQVANERAKGTENQADTALKYAKAGSEKAKARALKSSADKTDLDFVQQKDGTQFKQSMASEKQKFDHELGKKAADSMLDKETPSYGSQVSAPEVFNANNHYKKTPNDLVGADTPEQNLEDQLILRGSGGI